MKSMLFFGVLSTALLVSGCVVSEEDHRKLAEELDAVKQDLRSTQQGLGQFRYMALDPELVFSLSDVEFTEPDGKYDVPKVTFKASLRQTNDDFPLDNYDIVIQFSVLGENGQEISEFPIRSIVENGVLALAEDHKIYGLKSNSVDEFKLAVKDYAWYPLRRFGPK